MPLLYRRDEMRGTAAENELLGLVGETADVRGEVFEELRRQKIQEGDLCPILCAVLPRSNF
jgi:hypothetical protein